MKARDLVFFCCCEVDVSKISWRCSGKEKHSSLSVFLEANFKSDHMLFPHQDQSLADVIHLGSKLEQSDWIEHIIDGTAEKVSSVD